MAVRLSFCIILDMLESVYISTLLAKYVYRKSILIPGMRHTERWWVETLIENCF